MRRSLFIILISFFAVSVAFAQMEQEPCLTDQLFHEQLADRPTYRTTLAEQEEQMQRWIQGYRNAPHRRELITIPVVVHIVYSNEAENISDDQVFSQLDVLNNDFRFNNSNKIDIPGEFASNGADIEVEFCLAVQDPDGNPTDGITRTQTSVPNIGNDRANDGRYKVKHSDLGGQSGWDNNRYLNVWVAKLSGGILGFGCFPNLCTDAEDGIVVDAFVFGVGGSAIEPNHLGRTTVHEVGHFLDLRHIWGTQQNDCGSSDLIDDTPDQFSSTNGCPAHPKRSCQSNDMFMNYMDYTYDECVSMFTTGQKERMLAALAGPRFRLAQSTACQMPVSTAEPELDGSIRLFPNPADTYLTVDLQVDNQQVLELRLQNLNGQTVYEATTAARGLHNIVLSHLPTGVYLLRLQGKDAATIKKIVVAR
ncbi:MAG: M43 family zinc metalloprotease [Bacteroidota bacterium]